MVNTIPVRSPAVIESKALALATVDDQDNVVAQQLLQTAKDAFGIDLMSPPELEDIAAKDHERLHDVFHLDRTPSTIPVMEAWAAFDRATGVSGQKTGKISSTPRRLKELRRPIYSRPGMTSVTPSRTSISFDVFVCLDSYLSL